MRSQTHKNKYFVKILSPPKLPREQDLAKHLQRVHDGNDTDIGKRGNEFKNTQKSHQNPPTSTKLKSPSACSHLTGDHPDNGN